MDGLYDLYIREGIADGILAACVEKNVPFVLAGSIRDDGPLPGVISDVYEAQDAMRIHTIRATTIIGLATQLHSIATGNMTPTWQRVAGGLDRPARTQQFSMLSFDVSFQEIFTTLCSGGLLHLVDPAWRHDPPALLDQLEAAAVERVFLPYVALQLLA